MKEAAIVKEAARRAVREARVQSLQVRCSLPPLARLSSPSPCSCSLLWGKIPRHLRHAAARLSRQAGTWGVVL